MNKDSRRLPSWVREPEFPSHPHVATGNQVPYKVGSWGISLMQKKILLQRSPCNLPVGSRAISL